MAHLRPLRNLASQNQAPSLHGGAGPGKLGLGPAAGKAAVGGGGLKRAALGDIGNQRQAHQPPAPGGKKEASKPILTRSRAQANLLLNHQLPVASKKSTSSIQPTVTQPSSGGNKRRSRRSSTRRRRPSSEDEAEQPMDLTSPAAGRRRSLRQKQQQEENGHEADVDEESTEEEMEVETEMELEEEVAEARADLVDIDEDDRNNPQMAVEYVNEIYAYLRELEAKMFVKKNYLDAFAGNSKVSIKPRMRNLLVDWLIDVHQQFSLLQETLYLCVGVLDRYLQSNADKLATKQLQLVGVSCMFIAAKYEEMYPPELGDFVYITDSTYTRAQILSMEIEIMKTLRFDLGRPLPLNFLRRNSKAGLVDAQVHTLAKFVMELCIVEYKMAHIVPSLLAAAALGFSLRVLDPDHASLQTLWTPTLRHYTAYDVDAIAPVLKTMAKVVEDNLKEYRVQALAGESGTSKKKLVAVLKKYANKKFGKVPTMPQLNNGDIVKRMAEGQV